jgi:hexosaminidase
MRLLWILSVFCFFTINAVSQQKDPSYGIIPAPKSVVAKSGSFTLNEHTAILYNLPEDRKIAELFRDLIKEHEGYDLTIAKNFIQAPESMISFNSGGSGLKNEAYEIDISGKQILIKGEAKGVFYGMQTLSQLYLANKETKQLPQLLIKDEPRYAYRGLHLDVVRHFHSVDFVKKYIDLMAFYKINNFHWHLTDDQGWRLEIKKHPKLTEIGAFRAQTLVGNYHDVFPQRFDGKPYGGFYTQEEAKEVVAYAASKFITVIPEIEMPGHAVAALASYPHLACGDQPGPFKVEEKWGVLPDIFCAGKEQTFSFLEDVLNEVVEIFPSKYIHIGGDEAPKTRWKACPHCQKRIKNHKLKNEEELQSYFVQRMEKFLNKKGRSIIGWDEILEGGLAPNATVMSWRGVQGGIAAAKQNHDVIMTPSTEGLYLDHVQGRSDQEPLSIGGDGRIELIYNYNPTPASLPLAQQKHILGVQANMWSEYIPNSAKVEYLLFPRLMALSEIAWTTLENKNYKNFNEDRLPVHLANLDKTNTMYRVPTAIGAKDTSMSIGNSVKFDWKAPVNGSNIYYTIDGRTPDETTILYSEGMTVNVPSGEKREVKSIVITPSGKRSPVVTTWLVNRSPMEPAKPVVSPVQGGLKYYYVPGRFAAVSEIDTNLATKKGVVNQVSLTKITGKAREYGLVFTGYINVNETADFEFSLYSDDGSRLFINDELIIDNDGKHARYERAAGVLLKPGLHKIRLAYFDDGPGSTLRLSVKGTDGKKIELPAIMMYN